jgi:hypothetical protein
VAVERILEVGTANKATEETLTVGAWATLAIQTQFTESTVQQVGDLGLIPKSEIGKGQQTSGWRITAERALRTGMQGQIVAGTVGRIEELGLASETVAGNDVSDDWRDPRVRHFITEVLRAP